MEAKRYINSSPGNRVSPGDSRCLISRDALLHNAAFLRRTVGPDVKICGIVKAGAYGHSARIVCDTLCHYCIDEFEAPLIDALAVADLDEACALPDFPVPLLVLRPIENIFLGRGRAMIEHAIREGWVLTVCSLTAAEDLSRIAVDSGIRASVQIMIDTGMTRAGVDLPRFEELLQKVSRSPSLKLSGVYSHFACGEVDQHPFNFVQLNQFVAATTAVCGERRLIRHIANSGALFNQPASRLDMVRPGISLYGIDPTGQPNVNRPLRPVLKWTAPLLSVRDVPAGASVGYGQTFTTLSPTRIGLVGVGYADGYLRAFSNRAAVLIHGQPAPVIGNVSMDMITIDLTHIPSVIPGDQVTLIDDDPLSPASVYKLAQIAQTIPYEILCRIGRRVKRQAVNTASESESSTPLDPKNRGAK